MSPNGASAGHLFSCLMVVAISRLFHNSTHELTSAHWTQRCKTKKPARNGCTSREAETIACGIVIAEIFLALFWGETALESRHEAHFLAGRELQSQETPEPRT
jgi:hypothetical protein